MAQEALEKKLEKHHAWLRKEEGGERLVLAHTNLRRAGLSGATLRGADLSGADLSGADLSRADLSRANLRGANLRRANLRMANLRMADLRDANLDYTSWPMWCGSFDGKVDDRLVAQLIAHITRLDVSGCSDDSKEAVAALDRWKNRFCEFQKEVDKI